MITELQIMTRISQTLNAEKAGLDEIADRAGIPLKTLLRYAAGEILPDIENFARLCIALHISPDYLLCVKDEK